MRYSRMYDIVLSTSSIHYLSKLSKSDCRHVKEVLALCLGEYLNVVSKRCNKKLLKGSKEGTFRLHISMTHTVFYRVDMYAKRVYVDLIMGINQAHGKYGLFCLF